MHILITGGAGFIGSHLSIRLLQQQHHITIIDSLHEYYSVERKEKQLHQIKKEGTFTFYQENLLDFDRVEKIFKRHQFDIVIHLAAVPGVSYSLKDPLLYVDYDIKATINVLKLAGETNVKHVIFASSSSVYGNKQDQSLSEEMATGRVISPYAASKFSAESFCHVYQDLYQFQLTILRFFTVYGSWGRPDMAIPLFIDRCLQDEPITVYGRQSSRDYTYIDDIVAGIASVLSLNHQNETFNLGSSQPVSMDRLLSIIRKHFPEMKIIDKTTRPGDVKETWANVEKAHKVFNYKPTISIEEGIERTIQWAKQQL
ncbi:GDP-mannose 4,6-dehydratase [Aquibacillus sp. 3ASR75-11]|uniref:GDP-mannose 4,6-dehydratase n=1 Tax=Terrihalobacillus insolitus TaxID=2950438 RepID=A0A9X3WXF1_9BACI|nr:NAD-dependent epimerase/dehydratase family protein [Terrihalobacillus insolitus]MDC3425129.1 GDP-mannose 4,6-dehydratase [Terrihalobacillus insolitus]